MKFRTGILISPFFYGRIIFTLFLLVSVQIVLSQELNIDKVPIKVKGGSYLRLYDSLYYFSHDTTLYLPGSMLPPDNETVTRTKVFYDSLRIKASRSKLGSKIYDLVIVTPGGSENTKINNPITDNYAEFSGMTIREISVIRLDAFGTKISDPESGSSKEGTLFMNRTHFKTREFIIRNYLFFNSGDTVSPLTFSENERVLRKLSIIDDARFIVIPITEEEVDVIVVTKDVYSLGMSASFKGIKAGEINIVEKNLIGLGHELTFTIPYDYNHDYGPGFGIIYRMNNISRSLIDAEFSYMHALGRTSYQASLTRDFVTVSTKYAGGIKINETYTTEDLDTLSIPEPLEYNNLDIWGGRSFMLDQESGTRAIFAIRYIDNNVYRRPEITSTSYHSLQKYKLYLASAALSKQKYYKTNLIYNYGRSEDIPYGSLVRITLGREFNEFNIRNYYGAEVSFGRFVENFGYLYGKGLYSTFLNYGLNEQGMFNLRSSYISNLVGSGKYKMRYFINFDYTKGYNRFSDEYLKVNEKNGIRGFRNDSLRVNQRLICNIEAVSFSPIYFYGFRFVFFAFADLALIRDNIPLTLAGNVVSEIGVGLRFRNDNLIFNTLQIRLGYFPYPPPYSSLNYINVTSEKLLKPPDFNAMNPQIYPYR